MGKFSVWMRPSGGECRVRVDSLENARWLVGRLGQAFVFKTCEPIADERDSACCSFRVTYSSQMTGSAFERLLGAIPQVQLMH